MNDTPRIRWRAAGRTDCGRVRGHNEDRFLVANDVGLFLVADGMGGHATGEVASAMAAVSIHNFLQATAGQTLSPEAPEDAGLDPSALRLAHAVRKANRDIFEASSRHPEHRGMGSTLVALQLEGATATLAHVGDSRCYRIREGALEQLTEDHSLLAEALRQKPELSPAERALLPKNVITRALGMRPAVKVDVQRVPLEAGDLFLVCSDGLHGMLSDKALVEAATLHESLDECCELLITRANEAGGTDTISVVLVEVLAREERESIIVETAEVTLEDALAELEGVLPEHELARLRGGEPVEERGPRCPACSTPIPAGDVFCGECGRRVD